MATIWHGFAFVALLSLGLGSLLSPQTAQAAGTCAALPSHDQLTKVLKASIKPTAGPSNGGLDLNMWATVVDRGGIVCAVARSGNSPGDQWPGSRVISAQKANTANAFSLPGLALSTANLWAPTQPGGSLFGLQFSNPVNPSVAYKGEFASYGTKTDPLVENQIGGVNVFGGGLALYGKDGLIGAIGVSGDTSCADHNIAWRVRQGLGLDAVPAGVHSNPKKKNGDDGIVYDVKPDGKSAGGFGHPDCGNKEKAVAEAIGSG